jgi:hypothetical protein
MKNMLVGALSFLLIVVSSVTVIAQCNGNSVLTASQTIYLDSSNTVQRTVDEKSILEITKTDITITPGDDEVMKGPIKLQECKWATPFKEGKSVIKTTLSNNNETINVTITIEGRGGVITMIASIDNEPNKRIKLVADKYEAVAGK